MRIRRSTALVATGLSLLTAGCGTTVSGVASAPSQAAGAQPGLTVPSQGTDGLSAPGGTVPGSAGSAAGVGGTAGSTTGGTTSGGGAAPVTTTGATRSGGTAPGEPALAAAPGVTESKVYVGLAYSSDSAAGNRAIGAAGAAASYDARDVYNAIIKYANEHGGFAGRQLEPIYFNLSISEDQNSQAQAACERWTQDNKTFVFEAIRNDILRACAEKAGAVSMVGGDGIKSTFDRFPHFLDPTAIRLDRLGGVTVGGLVKAGYFAGKLGLITWDDTNYRYGMQHGYLPALSANGIKPAMEPIYIKVPDQIDGLGEMTAAVSNAVTKFRAAGVDHVIIADGPAGVWAGGGLTLEFMNTAKSQRYYPRYGQNAYNLPGNSVLPADQMDHALAIMANDDSARYDEGWHLNQAREKCYKIQADAGMPVKSSNSGDEAVASQACDQIFLIQQVMNSTEGVINSDSFVRTYEGMGTRFRSAFVYGTKFGPDRHDGGDMVRTAEYFQSCKCLKYKGPPYYPD